MSREVVGTAVPDVVRALALRQPTRPDDAASADRPAPPRQTPQDDAPPAAAGGGPPPRRRLRPRTVALVLTGALVVGSSLGWQGAGAWRQAQEREVALASTTASAAVVGSRDTGAAPASSREGARTASLTVRVVNLGGVPLQVLSSGSSFSAVRIRFLEPSAATLRPRGRVTVTLAVEVDCASPLPLGVPPLRVLLPDDESRDVPVEAGSQALAGVCAASPLPLVSGVAVPARTDVAALLDGKRFRLSLVVPSGRTTRIVAVRAGRLELTGDPLPMTVDGTARAMWLDPPDRCPASATAGGLPRSVQVDVDPGTGQTATVTVDVGDALAAWLLRGACGAPGAAA